MSIHSYVYLISFKESSLRMKKFAQLIEIRIAYFKISANSSIVIAAECAAYSPFSCYSFRLSKIVDSFCSTVGL